MRLLFIILFLYTYSTAQSLLRIGDWKSHMSHSTGNFVAQSPEYVFFGTNGGLVQVHKANDEIDFVTKVEGLSDISVQTLAWDSRTQRLLIAYKNSNLDIYDPASGKVVNLPDIMRNTRILGDRTIYKMNIQNGQGLLACGFGVVELNLLRDEFGFTSFTGVPVYESVVYKNLLYAGTEIGMYSIENDKSKNNPSDFSQWTFVPAFNADAILAMQVFNEKLYIGKDKSVLVYDGTKFSEIQKESSDRHRLAYLSANKNQLLAGYECIQECNGKLYAIDAANKITNLSVSCVPRPIYAIVDEKNRGWYADRFQAFRSNNSLTEDCNFRYFNTPLSPFSTDIALYDDNVYIASGGITASYSYLLRGDGFFGLKNGNWNIYNRSTNAVMAQNDLLDLYKMAVHPTNGLLYIGTFWGGLMQCDMKDVTKPGIKVFDKTNSSLQGATGDAARTRVGGLSFDRKGNLWMSNYLADRPISVLRVDGTWKSFSSSSNTNLLACAVDSSDNIWFSAIGQGIYVLNPGADLNATADDRTKLFNIDNSVLESNIINAIATDMDGSVWIGTNKGVFVFECGDDLFTTCKGSKRVILQLDLGAGLLSNEDVQCIAIDGANRKWFGTRNGIIVISAGGDELVARYTKENSPLFDNLITALTYDGINGLMYIGTGHGVQSLRIDATRGSRSNKRSDIYAFPNPVRPGYDGPITIQGLRSNSKIKITDFNGALITEGRSNGGTFIWNGKNENGKSVGSGVYTAWIIAGEGFESADTKTIKIAVVR